MSQSTSMASKIAKLLLFVPGWFLNGSPVKLDEEVICLPTSARQLENGLWEVPVHAWVFETEEGSLPRRIGAYSIGEFLEWLDVPEEKVHSKEFLQRIKWFMVDNERNKVLKLQHSGIPIASTRRSSANGHLLFNVQLKTTSTVGTWEQLKLILPDNDKRQFHSESQLIPAQGLSVISDIDDTIKISHVLDKEELVRQLFFETYQPTAGMPDYYQQLAQQGAYFHYLSASPWQLYPTLKPFMESRYPRGSYTMRHFSPADTSFIRFFLSSEDYKIDSIKRIISRYPGHQFLLIGDSGEKDPEVYATIYQQFPHNIKQILIREVEGSDTTPNRVTAAFGKVPVDKWQFFKQPDQIRLNQLP